MSYCTVTSDSSESASESSENAYCVFLHIVEGIGLQRSRSKGDTSEHQHDQILMHASLNNVKFEIEGHSTETVTIFNSNCVWECGLDDVKRMKTDNRPVRIECFLNNGTSCCPPSKLIGTLLLPVRGLPTITNLRNYQPKLLWHKLGALCSDWRPYKPEIYLLLVVTKKMLIDNHNFEALLGKRKMPLFRSPRTTETTNMLQSRSNVYVQLLEQVGLIQVGNNPDIDCDIFQVTLTLRRVKDLGRLLEVENHSSHNSFVFQYELLGSSSHDEIGINETDCYVLNEKIALKFKTSMRSLLLYFQRIFYIPINIYFNGHAIANYRFDCSKFFPDESYFNTNTVWIKHGVFLFDRLHKILSPRATKPSVEFTFGVQLMECNSRKFNKDLSLLCTAVMPYKVDAGAAGDNGGPFLRYDRKRCVEEQTKGVRINENIRRRYSRASSEPLMEYKGKMAMQQERVTGNKVNCKENFKISKHSWKDIAVGTTETLTNAVTIGVNTETVGALESINNSTDTESLTLKIVKELEAWKAQQMEEFVGKLESKEATILRNLENDQKKQQTELQQCLEMQKTESEQLKIQLEAANAALKAHKGEVTVDYIEKIQNLEKDVERLKTELLIQQKQSAIEKESEIIQKKEKERSKLENENSQLKKNIAQLEQKIVTLGKTHFSAEQLKEMMTDLRQQTVRFADVEKQRNYFKEQYSRTTCELRQLKLSMLKQQEMSLLRNSKEENNSCDISLDDLSVEAHIAIQKSFKTDRTEATSKSNTIRDMILLHSETSSLCEGDSAEH